MRCRTGNLDGDHKGARGEGFAHRLFEVRPTSKTLDMIDDNRMIIWLREEGAFFGLRQQGAADSSNASQRFFLQPHRTSPG